MQMWSEIREIKPPNLPSRTRIMKYEHMLYHTRRLTSHGA